jgi:hypothetical protein
MAGSRYRGRNRLLAGRSSPVPVGAQRSRRDSISYANQRPIRRAAASRAMTARLVAVISLVAMLTACDARSAPQLTDEPSPTAEPTVVPTPVTADPAWVDAETYAVYEAVFIDEYGSSVVTLDPYTASYTLWISDDDLSYEQGEMPSLLLSTVQNFNVNNMQSMKIDFDKFSAEFEIIPLDDLSYSAFFEGQTNENEFLDQWKTFDEAYPKSYGYLQLSRAGFSDDQAQALVHYGLQDGEFCIYQYLLLERQTDRWHVVDSSVGAIC